MTTVDVVTRDAMDPATSPARLAEVLSIRPDLAAVVAHEPAKAPLVVGFRQTENAINVPQCKGAWKSVPALGKVQRRYFDPVTGQAGFFGTVMEGNDTAIVQQRPEETGEQHHRHRVAPAEMEARQGQRQQRQSPTPPGPHRRPSDRLALAEPDPSRREGHGQAVIPLSLIHI